MFDALIHEYDVAMTHEAAALQTLSRTIAGRQLRVPHDPEKLMLKHPEIDRDTAQVLCEAHGGTRLYARKATRAAAAARNSLIRVRRTHGATIEQLAFEFDLSPRHISNILKECSHAS